MAENEKPDQGQVHRAMAELPDDIEIGESKRIFHIYPISIGKMKLITEYIPELESVFGVVAAKYKASEDAKQAKDLATGLADSLNAVVEVFNIVTQPNRSQAPYIEPLTDEDRKFIEFNLDNLAIENLILILMKQVNFVVLLKNIIARRVMASPKTSTSETLSQPESSSPAIPSSI